eukprot:UN01369
MCIHILDLCRHLKLNWNSVMVNWMLYILKQYHCNSIIYGIILGSQSDKCNTIHVLLVILRVCVKFCAKARFFIYLLPKTKKIK